MKIIKRYLKSELSLREAFKFIPSLGFNLFSLLCKDKNYHNPTFLTWILTDKCQLKCKHCLREAIPSFLSKKERLGIAEKIVNSSVNWVSLTGGEPLIIPELIDILRILKKKNKKVTITTNGLVLSEFLKGLIEVGLDAVHISMDSHKREIHDSLRECPGLFDKVLESISTIKAKRKSKGPLIKLRCTISKKNYRQLSDYIYFWKDKVDSIHFQPITDGNMNYVREKSLLFSKKDEKPFRNIFSELQKKYSFFKSSYYRLMPEFIFDRENFYKKLNYKCLLVTSSGLYLLPNGNVTVCYGRKEYIVGNATTETIDEIWERKSTMEVRKKISNIRSGPSGTGCFCWEPNTQFNLYLSSLYKYFRKFR